MKKTVAILTALTLLLATGCSNTSASSSAPAAAPEGQAGSSAAAPANTEVIKINFATNQPATHIVGQAYQGLVDELNELGGGRIEAKAYFSEQLGTEKELVDMTSNNINDVLCAPGPSELSTRYAPLMIFDAPYVFRSPEHMLAFANGEASQEIWDTFAKEKNLRVLGTYYFGRRYLTTKGVDVKTPDDLKGFKLRVIDAPISLATGKALGANPTPLAYSELYLALQQKIVDGQENPLANILSAKFYEVQDRLILTGHVTAAVCFAISEEKWQSFPDDIKEIVQTAVDHAVVNASKAIQDSEDAQMKELESYGMTIIEPDLEAFRKNAYSVIEEFQDTWGPDLYDLVQSVKE